MKKLLIILKEKLSSSKVWLVYLTYLLNNFIQYGKWIRKGIAWIFLKLRQISLITKEKSKAFLKQGKVPRRTKIKIGIMILTCVFTLLAVKVHYMPSKREELVEVINYLEKADFLYEKGSYQQAEAMYKRLVREISQEDKEKEEWIHYQLGNCYKNMGSLPEAISSYEAFIQEYPESNHLPETEYNLALCYKQSGNINKTFQILRKLIKKFPEGEITPKAYLELGNCLRKKDKKAAISTYQKIVKIYPRSFQASQAYLNIGDIYLEQQSYSEAILYYTSLLQQYPQAKEGDGALFNLSRCYLSRDEVDKAVPLLSLLVERFPESILRDKAILLIGKSLRAKKDYKKAIEVFREIQRIYPDNPIFIVRARENIAEIYLTQENFPEATRAYESILADYPYIKNAGEIYLKLAQSYKDNGDYKMASLSLEKFINYFPLSGSIVSAYITLGECLFKQNLYLEGIRAFQKATKNPYAKKEEIRQACFFSGEGYLSIGLWGRAIEAFRQSLPSSYDKEKLRIQLKIAECYLKKKDISSAKGFLSNLLIEFSKYNPLPQDYLKMGDLLSAIEEEKNALKMYEKAEEGELKLNERISLLHKMAIIDERLKDAYCAIGIYQKIINLSENGASSVKNTRVDSLFRLGDLCYSLKNYKQACSFYAKAVEEAPDNEKVSWSLYQMGNCYRHSGNLEKAKKFYQRLARDFPDAFWADMARTLNEIILPIKL